MDTSLIDLTWCKVTGVRESKNFHANYLTKFSINFDETLSIVETFCVMNFILIISRLFNMEGSEPY